MAMAGGIGASVQADGPEHAFFFGEDQGRYVLTAPPAESPGIAEEAKRLDVPPVAHRRHRGRDIEAWRRGRGCPCGARRSI